MVLTIEEISAIPVHIKQVRMIAAFLPEKLDPG